MLIIGSHCQNNETKPTLESATLTSQREPRALHKIGETYLGAFYGRPPQAQFSAERMKLIGAEIGTLLTSTD